ncbi:MAG: ATP-binding cassette domain-containing protein [Oscillospiraceae bacterium]|jgi:D-methionine transport system ATP-binding protein|nr:ATP-binding cassette domain-containing protein [Oscillospiraceae bacterium]
MIEIKHLYKTFPSADGDVEALKDITLTIEDGDIFGIIGMSGAGKSTLVRCINMLERPTSGQVIIDGKDLGAMSEKELRAERRNITMIFQHFNLLQQRTCLKNVCFPMELSGVKPQEAKQRAMELLALVGLPDKANAYPSQLSGGQQQRVAIARALATDPKVLLCDEATSALDPNTTHAILELIRDINQKLGITVVIITHQMSVVEEICQHVAILDGGEVAEMGAVGTVFSSPKSSAAKRLVFPTGADELVSDPTVEQRVRVVFNGADAAGKPLIATMAQDKGILVSILAASTRGIEGKAYGSMLLAVPGGKEQVRQVIDYLQSVPGVLAEEV